ncbi:MAG TPA: CBS domain-containing protein [Candidatus Thermoplasmatota archaeon]|nr:CBS domain-containing protein [Candidatus Thermoplasmatota archaeon]
MTTNRNRAEGETIGSFPGLLTRSPSTVRVGDSISSAIEKLVARPESRAVYVLDPQGKLVGVVSFRCILRVAKARYGSLSPGLFSLVRYFRDLQPETVEHLMRPATPVRADTPLKEALLLLEETKQNDLPVVDEEGKVVGELAGREVMALALEVFRKTEGDLARSRADS